MERNLVGKLGLVVLTGLFLAGGFALHVVFLVQNCYAGDDPAAMLAFASIQGKICGNGQTPVSLALLGFEAAAVVAVISLVLVRQGARDWVGKLGAWLVPVPIMALAWALLTLPPDDCSESAVATEAPSACVSNVADD